MEQQYRRANTSVSLVNYHFVWAPRYRRKILVGEVDRRFREILGEVAKELDVRILALEVMPDHVHLFVNAPPDLSPSGIIARIKGRTSKGRFSKTVGLGRSLRGCGRGWTPQMIREAQRL